MTKLEDFKTEFSEISLISASTMKNIIEGNLAAKLVREEIDEASLDKREYSLSFEEPIYVTRILVRAADGKSSLELSYEDGDRRIGVTGSSFNYSDGSVGQWFFLFGYAKKIIIKPITSKAFRTSKFKAILIYGHFAGEIPEIRNCLNKVEALYKNLGAELKSYEEVSERHENLERGVEALERKIDELSENRDRLTEENATSASISKDLKEKNDLLDGQMRRLKSDIEVLNKRAAELRSTIYELERNKDVFSDEFQYYSREVRWKVGSYIGLAMLPLGIITLLAIYLFSSSSELAQHPIPGIEDAFGVLITRMPFVVVCLAIIYACGDLIWRLLNRVIELHNEKVAFTKLNILAKDVTDAMAFNLQLSDRDKYQARINLKMRMLRAFASEIRKVEIDEDLAPDTTTAGEA